MNAAEAYHAVRSREGRLLSDEVVRGLPGSGANTARPGEWRVRANGLDRTIRTLGKAPLQILEVGCGNGWFATGLAKAGHRVTGIDTGQQELEQARRVFRDLPVDWLLGDPWSATLEPRSFDRIVLAASVQYFPDLTALFQRFSELLHDPGEVLIVDSPFYPDEAAATAARNRSAKHYAEQGVPEMAAFYHHHTLSALRSALKGGEPEIRPGRHRGYNPFRRPHPFPFIRIRI